MEKQHFYIELVAELIVYVL